MLYNPDIQVSRDSRTWFSIFNASHMMMFAALMNQVEIHSAVPVFYLRVQPDPTRLDYTPAMAMSIGQITQTGGST